jgi:hypothetical protein
MKKEKYSDVIDFQDFEAIYEDLIIKLIHRRLKEEEREKAVIIDKISIHTKGKELILENSKC